MPYLLLILFALLSVSGVGAQAELPPYIHYFNHLRGGLVIERADGTDSRMIADVPMDAGPPVWSASGKWMVIGNEIISTDGNQHIPHPLPALVNQLPLTLWSPDDDVILVVGFESTSGSVFVQIYEVETQIILANFEIQNPTFRDEEIVLSWELDGTRAFVSWPGSVVTLYRDGRTAIWVEDIRWHGITADFYRGQLFSTRQTAEGLTLRIEALNGEKLIDIDDHVDRPPYPYTVRWSPTLEHALIYARACTDNKCESWLKLVDWKAGEIETVTPPIRILPLDWECIWYSCTELWSPDGQFAVMIDADDTAYVLNATTRTMEVLPSKPSYYRWTFGGKLLWQSDGLYLYDPTTGEQTKAIEVPDGTAPYGYFPSPDGRYIAVPAQTPTVIDQTGAVVTQIFPHSHSTGAICCPSDYQWDANSEWLIAGYPIIFAGGAHSEIDVAVIFNIEGTVRRELPYQGFSGFLPDRAMPYLSPGEPVSAKKEPVMLLPQDGRVQAVGWHPTDPDRLVTFSADTGLVFWSLAGGMSKVTEQIPVKYPREEIYQIDGTLYWLPERSTVAINRNGDMFAFDPQLDHLPALNGFDYPRLVRLSEGQAIQYSQSGETVELNTASPLAESYLLASDFSGFITGDDVDHTNNFLYVDNTNGRVVPLETIGLVSTIYSVSTDVRYGVAFLGSIYDCCVTVVSTEDGHLIDQFYGTAVSLAISADGRRLATTSAGMTAIWDISEYLPTD
jgi:hypothetical protein